MTKERIFAIIFSFAILPFILALPLQASQDLVPAKVKDISDRAYEPAVIELLDGAKESIYISMYIISVTDNERDPVRFLLKDLLEALGRGVEVSLNLNTRFKLESDDEGEGGPIGDPVFDKLKDAGCKIHLMPRHRRLHDKLIIVDGRYVVEGSTNWSTSALKSNNESATLIDSPELAGIKIARIEAFINEPDPDEDKPPRALYLEGLPDEISVPGRLLLDKGYLSLMVTKKDQRGMDLYLLLLAHSQATGERELFIDLEDMGLSIGIPDTWKEAKIRQHVILPLRRLMNRYKLISAEFYWDKDAWIEMKDTPGESFKIPSSLARPDSGLSLAAKFLLIVKSYLSAHGEDFNSISGREIARRFKVSHTTVNNALEELGIRENKGR